MPALELDYDDLDTEAVKIIEEDFEALTSDDEADETYYDEDE